MSNFFSRNIRLSVGDFLLKNIRFSVTLILFVVAIVLLTIILPLREKSPLWYTIGLSVSSVGLSTTLTQFIFLLTETAERFTNQKRFLKVFSCDQNSIADGAIAIVIPAFTLGGSTSSQSNNILKQYAETILSSSSTKAGIQKDVAAASYIISAFSKLGLPIPQIIWDEEANLDNENIKTYILIGLSNSLLDLEGRYFKVRPTPDNNNDLQSISIKIGSFHRGELLPENDWNPAHSVSVDSTTGKPRNNTDIALFAKVRKDKKYFVICGAGTESGTLKIGKYISGSGWQEVDEELKKEKGMWSSITAKEEFAISFKVRNSEQVSGEILIAHKCIRKNT